MLRPHRPRSSLVSLFVACRLLVACGGSDEPADPSPAQAGSAGSAGQAGSAGGGAGGTAGTAGQGSSGGGQAGAPTPPAAPVLTPCPAGWSEKTQESGQVTCEPGPLPSWECAAGWTPRVLLAGTPLQYSICEPGPLPSWTCPAGWEAVPLLEGTPRAYSACRPPALPDTCPAGQMSVVGQKDCQPIGDPCPAGDFPTTLPAGKMVVYAKAGATGGDGSLTKPFGSLSDALAAAPEGGVVAVGTGVYAENLTVSKSVSLWGRCATAVGLGGAAQDKASVTVAKGGSVEVRNLTVGGAGVGLLVQAGGTLTAQGLWVHQATGIGIEGAGGTLSLTDILVSETAARADKTDGMGVSLHDGAQATGQRLSLESNHTRGLLVLGAKSQATVSELLVRGTQSQPSDHSRGRGLQAQEGAIVQVDRGLFEHNRDLGVSAFDAGTAVSLTDVVIENTQSRETDQSNGVGLDCEDGAQVTLLRGILAKNREAGLTTVAEKSSVSLTDVVIENTQSRESDLTGGWGINGQTGATVKVERALFDHNRASGILVFGAGLSLSMIDVVVQNTESQEFDSTHGWGLESYQGAQVTVQRAFFDHNRDTSVVVHDAGSSLTMSDAVVQNTQSQESDKTDGWGFYGYEGAQVTIERALFDQNRHVGVLVGSPETSVTLSDVVVQNTQSQESDLTGGRGLGAEQGGQVTVKRALFDQNREAGLVIHQAGTSLSASDLVVQNTQIQASDGAHGRGLDCENCQLAVERAFFDKNQETGLTLSGSAASATLRDLVVQNTLSQQVSPPLGEGLFCTEGAQVKVERAFFDKNREAGVAVAQAGSSLSLTDVLIQNTQGRDTDQQNGSGASAVLQGSLEMTRVVLQKNRAAAVLLLQNGTATLTDCSLLDTIEGSFTSSAAQSPVAGVSDGFLALSGSSAKLVHTVISGCSRAGLLFDSSTGQISSTRSSGNRFGLVLQGATAPTYDATDSFAGNSEQSIVTAGTLPVPNDPLGLPPPPPSHP